MKEWKHTEHLLITLRRLGKITKEVREANVWTGYSRGFKLRIELIPGLVTLQEPISRHRMLWGLRAPGGRQLCNGAAETVLDCVRAMEAAAAEWSKTASEEAKS